MSRGDTTIKKTVERNGDGTFTITIVRTTVQIVTEERYNADLDQAIATHQDNVDLHQKMLEDTQAEKAAVSAIPTPTGTADVINTEKP